jgi:hypothetical protein
MFYSSAQGKHPYALDNSPNPKFSGVDGQVLFPTTSSISILGKFPLAGCVIRRYGKYLNTLLKKWDAVYY